MLLSKLIFFIFGIYFSQISPASIKMENTNTILDINNFTLNNSKDIITIFIETMGSLGVKIAAKMNYNHFEKLKIQEILKNMSFNFYTNNDSILLVNVNDYCHTEFNFIDSNVKYSILMDGNDLRHFFCDNLFGTIGGNINFTNESPISEQTNALEEYPVLRNIKMVIRILEFKKIISNTNHIQLFNKISYRKYLKNTKFIDNLEEQNFFDWKNKSLGVDSTLNIPLVLSSKRNATKSSKNSYIAENQDCRLGKTIQMLKDEESENPKSADIAQGCGNYTGSSSLPGFSSFKNESFLGFGAPTQLQSDYLPVWIGDRKDNPENIISDLHLKKAKIDKKIFKKQSSIQQSNMEWNPNQIYKP